MDEDNSQNLGPAPGFSNAPISPRRMAAKMQLLKGMEAEYKRRHDAIWPELKALLLEKGITEYGIYLDEESGSLFAVMQVEDPALLENLPSDPIMKRWWTYMKDIMVTRQDDSPVTIPLKEVFYLP